MGTPRIAYYARHDAKNPAEIGMLKDVEKHLRDQVVLRCFAILEDPTDADELDKELDNAYSWMPMTPMVARNIRGALLLVLAKIFPNGCMIPSRNSLRAIARGKRRPRRRVRPEQMQSRAEHLEAAGTHGVQSL